MSKLNLPVRRIPKIALRDKAEALKRFYLDGDDLIDVLTDIYARYGRDASELKRPHATITQWRLAVEWAIEGGDEDLLTCCAELGIAATDG